MATDNVSSWQVDRRVSLGFILQVVVLATLIIGSWVNLQRQLDLLQRDVSMLLDSQERFCEKTEKLEAKCIAMEWRIHGIEPNEK